MSRKDKMDEKPLTSRCLAVVLKEKRSSKIEAQCSDSRKSLTSTGKELFEEFTKENKRCYWNPHLEESIKSLRYVGCIHSSTILVGGRDIYLDTVKGAWARKVLRAPAPFTIQRVGDVPGIDMFIIEQAQFTPLPEALCLIISEVTNSSLVASFDLIMENLSLTYKGMQQPSEQIVYETLGSLLKERKIYHTGNGYAIVTPETFQLTNMNLTVNDHHLVIGGDSHVRNENGVPTLYIPLMPSNKNDMCSIACQTTVKDMGDTILESLEDPKDEKGRKLERSRSMRESKKGKDKKEKEVGLTRSASVKYSDEKAKAIVKDVNLKSSDINQDKDKGEKSSVLSKIFGRNKKKKAHAAIEEECEDKDEVEYATFSAQFPPPEWEWYESQVHQAIDVHQQSVSKSRTWHYLQSPGGLDADEYYEDGDIFDYHKPSCPVHKSRTLPEELRHGGPGPSFSHPPLPRARSCSSDSMEVPLPPQPATSTPQSPRKREHLSESRRYSSKRRSKHEREDKSRHADVKPKSSHKYTDYEDHNESIRQPDEAKGAECLERPSHVARVFRKYKEMKGSSYANNDITVEYCGKLPKKGSFGMSRDSGVNCVGLNNERRSSKQKADNNKTSPKSKNILHEAPLNNINEGTNNGSTKLLNTPKIQDNLHPANYSGISPYTTHAQVHSVAEQEDSGFNSPRTLDLSESGHVLPRPIQCHTPREEHSPGQDSVNMSLSSPLSSRQQQQASPPSLDRVPITGSEFYPTYANGGGKSRLEESRESPFTGSNMWSDSSKQTVQEVEDYEESFPGPSRSSSMPPPNFHRSDGDLSPIRHHSLHRDTHSKVLTNGHSTHLTSHKSNKPSKGKKSGSHERSSGPGKENIVNGFSYCDNNNETPGSKVSMNNDKSNSKGYGVVGMV